MPHHTRRGFAAFGNSYDLSQRATAIEDEEPLSYEETRSQITAMFLEFAKTGVRPDPAQLARVEAGLREGLATGRATPPPLPPDPVVYYFRVGNRIKIGSTRSLHHRARDLMPEEVLGTEPGDATLERRRHRQFAAHRISGEWFEDCPAIRNHIASFECS